MRRSDFMILAGADRPEYESRVRRGLVPSPDMLPSKDLPDTAFGHRTWGNYTAFQAVLWELTSILTDEGGLALKVANNAVSNCRGLIADRLPDAIAAHATGAPFVYAGIVQGTDSEEAAHVVGSLSEIAERLEGAELRRRANKEPGGPCNDRIFLADIGKAIATVRARARDAGIELPADVTDWLD